MSKSKFEKDILQDSEKIQIPEELNKENMMARIEKAKKTDASIDEGAIADRYIDIGKKQIKRFHKNVFKAVSLATCFMFCAVAINQNQVKQVSKPVEGERADNYRQIYNKLCDIKETYYDRNYVEGGFWSDFFNIGGSYKYRSVAQSNSASAAAKSPTEGGLDVTYSESENAGVAEDYSKTNVRTEDVDEGDLVKTD